MPGQAVTDLKAAGIDVQIQKGKVVIAKDKVITKKGEAITSSVAKALHTLDINPFSATLEPLLMLSGSMHIQQVCAGHRCAEDDRGHHDWRSTRRLR